MEFMKIWDSRSCWEKANFMYGTNMSFREIEAALRIPRTTLHRRALSEKWVKGCYMPMVLQLIKVEELVQGLTPTKRKAVALEVKRQRKLQEQYEKHPNIWLKKLMAAK
jgi:hypothetical protein